MKVNISFFSTFVTKLIPESSSYVENLFNEIGVKGPNRSSFFVLCNGRKIPEDSSLENGKTYHIIPRLPGGKGGFGSMLRAIGAQIEKTTSREACRDLSGRRMRDINNEKKLKEWLGKEAERERDHEQRRQERLSKRQTQPQHKFDDTEYHQQRVKMQDDLQDAVTKGLKRAHQKVKHHSTSKKMKATAGSSTGSKAEWVGVDIDSESSSNSDTEADPGYSHLQAGDEGSSGVDHTSSHSTSSSSSPGPSDCVKQLETNLSDQHAVISPQTSQWSIESTGVIEANDHPLHKTLSNELSVSGQQNNTLLSALPPPSTHDDCESEKFGNTSSDAPVDLDKYNSSQELARLGMERLKNALMSRGLKCGGTLEERAERLFSVKGLEADQIDPSLFAKLKGKGKKSK